MKILYNDINSNNDFKHFIEWYFLRTEMNSLKKKEQFNNSNFLVKWGSLAILYVIIYILSLVIYKNCDESFLEITFKFLMYLSIFYIVLYILAILGYLIHYRHFKKMPSTNKKNTLIINEEGITDITNDITLSNTWKQLTHMFVGEHYIALPTASNVFYIFPIEIKNRLISGIKKYNTNQELKIIEKSK